jgi:hypothetical protein
MWVHYRENIYHSFNYNLYNYVPVNFTPNILTILLSVLLTEEFLLWKVDFNQLRS